MYKLIFSILTACLFWFPMAGQEEAPDLKCASLNFDGDVELEWNLPVLTCGVFNAYIIYFSETSTGPYTVLDSITNPGQSTFLHQNPGSTRWYYYMETGSDCPASPLQSDTLDSEKPLVPEIELVTVNDNNDVEISWLASASPETEAYVLFWESVNGFSFLDTIYGRDNTFYLHTGASPHAFIERYTIAAVDACENTSNVGEIIHNTILLTSTINICTQSITLDWNLYQNWPNGIDEHQLWLSINGETAEKIEEFEPERTTYTYGNVIDGYTYCFSLRSVQANRTDIISISNLKCETLDVVQPMRFIYLNNISVNESNEVELAWRWDTRAEISSIEVLRSESTTAFNAISTQSPVFPLVENNSYNDITATPEIMPFYYRLRTTDDCDSTQTSTTGRSIHLATIPQSDFRNTLEWTAFDIEFGTVLQYVIHEIINGQEVLLATVEGTVNTYDDLLNPYDPTDAQACYRITAHTLIDFPDGVSQTVFSQSNVQCAEQEARILVPNAFTPDGNNPVFKPLVVFGENIGYSMVIFSRWGGSVFETNNFNDGWDGTRNGKGLPQGIYAYLIQVIQPDGSSFEKKGTVLLLR